MMPLARGWHLELLLHCFRIESNILMSPISEDDPGFSLGAMNCFSLLQGAH